MRPTDAAYNVLKNHGQPMDVQDLLDETLSVLGKDREPQEVARIYTDINMDVRFQYRGGSLWGLKEWQPKGSARSGAGSRDRVFEEDESEEIEEDEG